MGEAVYYGKLRFKDEAAAKKAFSKIKRFFVQCCRAEDFWQQHRDREYHRWADLRSYRGKKYLVDDEFWAAFAKKFPQVTEYLRETGNDYLDRPYFTGDRANGLAGMLDPVGYEDDVEYMAQYDEWIQWHSEVWHMADWDPLISYLERKYDCEGHWLSDEYLDVWHLVDEEFE